MSNFINNEKVIASSKCTLIKGLTDPDPNFCKIILTESALVFLNDEYSKRDELLFYIPISQINDFIFINQKEQIINNFVSIGVTLLNVAGAAFNLDKEKTDILGLTFTNEDGEKIDFILNMMEQGENGLIHEYKKLFVA